MLTKQVAKLKLEAAFVCNLTAFAWRRGEELTKRYLEIRIQYTRALGLMYSTSSVSVNSWTGR